MVAMSLTSLVVIAGFNLFIQSARRYQDGTEHNSFINEARIAEQKISDIIQYARAASTDANDSNSLDIVQPDLTISRLYFQSGNTPETSVIRYDPDIEVSDDEETICVFVSEIPDTPMFQTLPQTTNTTQVSFYVGLRAPTDGSTAGVRKSYTGALVYMTATPRNIVDFIQ